MHKKYDKPSCHPDRKHYAKGFCLVCYRKQPSQIERIKRWKHTSPKYAAIKERYETKRTVTASWRSRWLKKQFGITEEDYNKMLTAQGGVCLLCNTTRGRRRLAVDHNHATNKVRGLLCGACNRVLGYVENKEWLTKAQSYLGCQDGEN